MRQRKTAPFYRLLILAVAALALLTSGCAGGAHWTWQHPAGVDSAALQQAEIECRKLAENELNRLDYYRPYYEGPFYYNRYYRYGHFRPYYLQHSYYDFHRYNIDLNRLYRFCMQAKGWQRVKVDQAQQQIPE